MNRLRIISWLAGIFWMSGLVQAQDARWSCDMYAWQYDMTVYGALQLHGADGTVVSGDYEVAAFCGDECRGVATVEAVPGEEVSYYYMRVRSNVAEGEEMTFKCYDRTAQKEVEIATVLPFAEGTLKGYPSEPFVWQERAYDIVLEATAGGSVSGGGSYVRGEEVTLTATPDEGYHFVEWSDGTTDNPYLWTVDGDKELSAVFEPNSYTLTYVVDGETWQTVTLAYGSAIQAPEAPEKEGHTFSGWSEVPATMPARDVEVTGSFTVNSYTLTYVVDGEVYTTVEVPYGSEIVPIDAPERPGSVFSGWQNVPETMPAHDVEVSGSFTTGIQEIVRDGGLVDVYDVRGVLVRSRMDVRELRTLPDGLYIINGQKVLVR